MEFPTHDLFGSSGLATARSISPKPLLRLKQAATNLLKLSMTKPSNDLSDETLHQGLATGEYEGRDALVAEEILRRRHRERARTGAYRLGFIGAWAAALWLWIKVRLRPRRI